MTFLRRVLEAASLRTKTFEEVRDDPNAGNQALLLLGLFSAVGSLFVAHTTGIFRVSVVIFFFISQFLFWFAQVWVILQVGKFVAPKEKHPTYDQLFRTASFSFAPVILMAWTLLLPEPFPAVGWLMAAAWFLVAFCKSLLTAFRS